MSPFDVVLSRGQRPTKRCLIRGNILPLPPTPGARRAIVCRCRIFPYISPPPHPPHPPFWPSPLRLCRQPHRCERVPCQSQPFHVLLQHLPAQSRPLEKIISASGSFSTPFVSPAQLHNTSLFRRNQAAEILPPRPLPRTRGGACLRLQKAPHLHQGEAITIYRLPLSFAPEMPFRQYGANKCANVDTSPRLDGL